MDCLLSVLENTNIQKSYFGETRRTCAPKETFERVRKFFPVFGITRVANITGLDRLGVPVYVACRPNSRSLSVSQGKGYTHDAARASAVMESIESYHAERIHHPLLLCSHDEIFYRSACIDVTRLPRYKTSGFNKHRRIHWIEGIDIFTRKPKWLPFETVHVDYRNPLPEGHGCFVSSSNGLSSGNQHHEAIIHGLCEVIERDALTLWSRKPLEEQQKDKVMLDTIDDKAVRDILSKFEAAGLDAGVWDITSDIGAPAFLCRILPSVDPEISGQRPASGMGCHLSKDIALLRAVTEAAQSRLTFISGARDDMARQDYARFLTIDEYFRWQKSIRHPSARDYRQIKSLETPTLDGDLNVLCDMLRARGITEAAMVDLTRPEFGIPVTRIVVPGLESFPSLDMLPGERAGRVLQTEDT